MKHLREKQVGYWQHWSIATRAGLALLVHAWLPDVLSDYASRLICPDREKEEKTRGVGSKEMD
jgi:hypothetical protein